MAMKFDEPSAELEALAKALADGSVVLLRDLYDKPRRTRQPLAYHTSRIWLFPFGCCPHPHHPIQVFRNGMMQHMDVECKIYVMHEEAPVGVAVFDKPTHPEDTVQASFTALPVLRPVNAP